MPTGLLLPFIPDGLTLDRFDNETWASIVAFTMENIRPRGLPAVPAISDFHELNLRTYVTDDGKPGVYFLHISAQKAFSTWLAKRLSGLPYQQSAIIRKQKDANPTYTLINRKKAFSLNAEFVVNDRIKVKSALDIFLTERYCLYFDRGKQLFRYEIHHPEWKLNHVDLKRLTISSTLLNMPFYRMPDSIHYSEGVKVLAWGRRLVR